MNTIDFMTNLNLIHNGNDLPDKKDVLELVRIMKICGMINNNIEVTEDTIPDSGQIEYIHNLFKDSLISCYKLRFGGDF